MSDEIFEGAPEPVAPPLTAPEDIDLGDAHIEREQQIAQAGAVGAMRKKYPHLSWDGPGTGTADATPEKPTQRPRPSGDDPPDVAAELLASMGRGSRGADEAGIDWSNELYGATIGAPNQALGGALDAAKETGDMAREFNDWVTENVGPVAGGGIIVDEEGLRFASGDEIQNTETFARWLLPDIERADSVTGGLVRGISQFVTGFMGAGKIKALKGISNPLAQATARGAVADFSVFDPHEDRLSDLIQQYPAIANPVSEFLSADPGDSAAEGRLKSAVEGLGLGLATEVGLRSFRALVTGLKTLRAMRQAKGAASEAVDPLQGVVDTAERRREELTELIGDPEAPRVEVRARGDFGDLELERSGDAARADEGVVPTLHGSNALFDNVSLESAREGDDATVHGWGINLEARKGPDGNPVTKTDFGKHTYQVDVNAPDGKLLDHEKPLTEQHPDIQAAFERLKAKYPEWEDVASEWSSKGDPLDGRGAYWVLQQIHGLSSGLEQGAARKAASLELMSEGVSGAKYSATGGADGFVIWDEGVLTTVSRDGVPTTRANVTAYHATDVEFDEFGDGIHYFAETPELAENAAIKTGKTPTTTKKVQIPSNLLRIRGESNGFALFRVLDHMLEDGHITDEQYGRFMDRYDAAEEAFPDELDEASVPIWRDLADELGVDGFKFRNEFDAGINIEGTGQTVAAADSYIIPFPERIGGTAPTPRAEAPTEPWQMTREEWLGEPTITKASNAKDLRARGGKTVEDFDPEPFMEKYSIYRGQKKGSSRYVVTDGETPIATYDGETLVVDKPYRKQGIATALIEDFRTNNMDIPPARERTKAAQALQKSVHRNIVTRAVDEGKPVPPEVLADYPRLISKAEANATGPELDYRGQHTAPGAEHGAPMHEMDRMYPDDIYSPEGARYYGSGGEHAARDKAVQRLLVEVRGNPDAEVTVYRGVPEGTGGEIRSGDWVTPDRQYAEDHAARYGEGEIQVMTVRAGDLYTEGNSLYEFGWEPRAEAPAVAEAREAVEAIKRMKVAELREAGLMPEKGGRKRDLLEEAEKRLEEAEQLAKTEEPAGGMGTEEAAQAVAGARAVPDGGASAAEGSGEVFINWARIDSVDDVKAVMQDMADASAESIDVARRGVRSWEQTRLDAESIDAWDMLMERRTGEPLNAEQSVAARELWAQSGAKLRALGQGVVADPGSEMARIAFRRQLTTHNFIQESTIAARTEIARALNAWKMPAGDGVDFSGQFDQLREMAAQDKDALDIASRLVALSDAGLTKEADAFVYGTYWAKGAGMIRQLWYFSLLSGPHTHMRNMISNTATIGLQIMERKAASVLGRALGEQNIPDGETAAMTFGVIQGFKDAFRISAKGRQVALAALEKRRAGDPAAAKEMLRGAEEEFGTVYRSLATGQSGFGVGKVETPPLGAFDPERLGIDKDNPWARVASYVDTVTRAPGTALMVEDEIFKSINYRAELNAQAHRQASKELNSGQITKEGFKDRLTELVNDPTEALRLEARDFAQKGTFTNTPLDTGAWKSFSSVQKYPVIGRIIMPFRRTAYNIAIFSYQRTPLAPLTKQWRDDLMAGGARADLAWSKFLVGNAILASFADLAMSRHVSGEGPSSPGQRAHERRMNRAPYSVRVHTGGDPDDPENYRNFSYRGLEPIAFHLGVASNIVEILEERDWDDDDAEVDELIIVASMAIANQVTSANFMSGVSGFFEMMSDSRRYGERWTSRLAGAAVPTGIAQVGRGLDPTSRAIGDWVSQIRSRTPVLSKDLPANRDVWGRKIDRSSGLGTAYDFMSPLYSSQKKIEPIDRELERLELWLNKPGKVVSFDGVKVNLRNHLDVWSRYVELSGNALKETEYGTKVGLTGGGCMEELNALVGGDHPMSQIYGLLSDGPEGGKADQIRQIQGQYREAARDQLLEEFPWLKAEVEARESEKATKWDMEKLMQGANR